MGKHNLSISNEEGSTEHKVWDVIINPDWDSFVEHFDADVSVVILADSVDLSGNIIPICLPRSGLEVVGTGVVVGWGRSERSNALGNPFDSTPNMLETPVVADDTCFKNAPEIKSFASNRTFCGGYFNQSKATCVGDSGGGFMLQDPATKQFTLAGIISSSVYEFNLGCNIEVYSLLTNVVKFDDWIKTKMEESQEVVWKDANFDCKDSTGWMK